MRLGDLFGGVPEDASSTEIKSLAFDDRKVENGTLFFCVPGFSVDGHDFATAAQARGAAALVVERRLDVEIPQVVVPDVRKAMGPAAAAFFGHPTEAIEVVGVTGTNGKTTTAYLVRALLEAAGQQCGLLGTVESIAGGQRLDAVRTTPEAIELQQLFAAMRDGGDRCAAIEVSSHALDLGRVDGTRFAASIFTNLTQDHLDWHGTMEAYWRSKRRLFDELPCGVPIINVDDAHGAALATDLTDAVTCGIDSEANWRASSIETGLSGTTFELNSPLGRAEVSTPLPGHFNVLNILGAAAAASALGVGFDSIVEAIGSAAGVPGRFEPVSAGQPFAVLVDYAHTPDSLENVLRAARGIADSRVICVVGCGGDRDAGKRPLMGRIAAEAADLAIITSDNPRSEDPAAIVAEVAAGAGDRAVTIIDRREAIQQAIDEAGPGDVVLIAGKGHEQGQEFEEGRKVTFDDRLVAREALAQAGWEI